MFIKAKAFYKDLFGLHVTLDMGENVMLTEGLVLQERKLWESFTKKEVIFGNHAAELYFEENNIEDITFNYGPYDYRNKAMLELLYASGVRITELINLKVSDVDITNCFIRVFGKGKKERIN